MATLHEPTFTDRRVGLGHEIVVAPVSMPLCHGECPPFPLAFRVMSPTTPPIGISSSRQVLEVNQAVSASYPTSKDPDCTSVVFPVALNQLRSSLNMVPMRLIVLLAHCQAIPSRWLQVGPGRGFLER